MDKRCSVNYSEVLEDTEEYLEHHGILGMHWGDRNGPPYPLNSSQKTAEEKRKAKSSGKSGGSEKKAAKKKAHEDAKDAKMQKKQAKVDATAAEKKRKYEKGSADYKRLVDVKEGRVDVSELTNQEYNALVQRMNLDAQYRNMTMSNGERFVNDTIAAVTAGTMKYAYTTGLGAAKDYGAKYTGKQLSKYSEKKAKQYRDEESVWKDRNNPSDGSARDQYMVEQTKANDKAYKWERNQQIGDKLSETDTSKYNALELGKNFVDTVSREMSNVRVVNTK
jgi:hypothetical protein